MVREQDTLIRLKRFEELDNQREKENQIKLKKILKAKKMKKLTEAQNMRMAFSNSHSHIKKKGNYTKSESESESEFESNNNTINWKLTNKVIKKEINSKKRYDILKIEEESNNNNNLISNEEINYSPNLSRINTPKLLKLREENSVCFSINNLENRFVLNTLRCITPIKLPDNDTNKDNIECLIDPKVQLAPINSLLIELQGLRELRYALKHELISLGRDSTANKLDLGPYLFDTNEESKEINKDLNYLINVKCNDNLLNIPLDPKLSNVNALKNHLNLNNSKMMKCDSLSNKENSVLSQKKDHKKFEKSLNLKQQRKDIKSANSNNLKMNKKQMERSTTCSSSTQNSLSTKSSNNLKMNKKQNEIIIRAAPDNLKTTYTSIHEKTKNKLKNKIELRLSLNESSAISIIKRTGISSSKIPRPVPRQLSLPSKKRQGFKLSDKTNLINNNSTTNILNNKLPFIYNNDDKNCYDLTNQENQLLKSIEKLDKKLYLQFNNNTTKNRDRCKGDVENMKKSKMKQMINLLPSRMNRHRHHMEKTSKPIHFGIQITK